ncbi:MAG TPA: hypothetical protein VEA80_07760 [Vitreimonas sp.]|uniref:hypothetical protein n=1 Tax=Vitreimonas sp. TaxID=3069702 RepID=UPI002D6D7CD2|nr:hypothetical protein [Vitreimonas sp.]HYD87354.1 hypothetical protein [Vitreimonas sp.]
MNQPLDPFAQNFDSIDIAQSGVRAAFEHAVAISAPTAAPEFATPGFYLLDDAGGRFVVDRDFGVVSLKDDALLATEHGAVHGVRLKVVEASGSSYELDIQLRLTGRVPQMVGAEDFGFMPEQAAPAIVTRPRAQIAWTAFAATHDAGGAPCPLSSCGAAPYGALVCAALPAARVPEATLILGETPPHPSGKSAVWSI